MAGLCSKLRFVLQLVLILNIVAVFTISDSDNYTDNQRKVAWEKLEDEMEQLGSQTVASALSISICTCRVWEFQTKSQESPNASESLQSTNKHEQNTLTNLKSDLTIQQAIKIDDKFETFPLSKNLAEILNSEQMTLSDSLYQNETFKKLEQVSDAITRILRFYDYQLDQLTAIDTGLALMFLKGIDDKHGKHFQKLFPVDQYIQNNCQSSKKVSPEASGHCVALSHYWKNRSGSKVNIEYWKEKSVLQKALNQAENKTLENIGTEKEEIWALMNIQCQMALTLRCEIPYVCERTLLDPTPRSQYLLTHQLLQRLLIETVDCPSAAVKSFVTKDETYNNLCAKIYMEAKYLDILDVPILYRDLFTEMVGFCGYMGYTNFFRDDWLQRILSWQSKSESGCFTKDPMYPIGVLSSDMGIKRHASKKEQEQGVLPNEKCLPHFTAVSLIALSAHWDFLMDLQSK